MFKRLLTTLRRFQIRLVPTLALIACLLMLAYCLFILPRPHANQAKPLEANQLLAGERARDGLAQTGDGQSLAVELKSAGLELQWQARSPFADESGGGYLGISPKQNLSAWFKEDGVTVMPAVADAKGAASWRLGMKLKAYGYGAQVQTAPPITMHKVKENRIDYVRSEEAAQAPTLKFPTVDFKLPATNFALNAVPKGVVEWYENTASGIEQGFTLEARPERASGVAAHEPLRLVMELTGELRARAHDEGQEIELRDGAGKRVLNYSKLMAVDAMGRPLAARMETRAGGREITLVVDDSEASYPVTIDPLLSPQGEAEPTFRTWEEKAKLESSDGTIEEYFGRSVDMSGDAAIVGSSNGKVRFFRRSADGKWELDKQLESESPFGLNVAISNDT
ncbi:MAG TPA: FG-GAP repeat protein, partial [Pyrinomonadaceae bacterium]|nr:FG-GAP repeat protein [Pyrinomonadaceae bacterium]